MKIKLGLYEKSMPDKLSLHEKLYESKQAGYDFFELSIDESDARLSRLDWTQQQRLELVQAIYETGQPIKTICLSGHRRYPLGSIEESASKKSLKIMEAAIKLACDLGVRVIQIAGYDEYYNSSNEQTRHRFNENLIKSVELAAEHGVILAFETMETPFINTVEKAMKHVKLVNSPYLQVYPDTGNITCAAVENEEDAILDLETGAGHIAAIHLKESKPGVFREVDYGHGHVDFANMVKQGVTLGVRLFVAEFWYNPTRDWRQELKKNREILLCYFK